MARIVTRNNLDADYFEFDEDAKKIRPTGFAGHKEFGFEMDQIQARINAAQGLPAPSWHHEFGGGASILDPRVTFSRSTPAWYFDKQGVLREAAIDEPVIENGVLRLETQDTNIRTYSEDPSQWTTRIPSGTQLTLTPNYALAPDGSMTATRVQMHRSSEASGILFLLLAENLQFSKGAVMSLWIKDNGSVSSEVVWSWAGGDKIAIPSAWERVVETSPFTGTTTGSYGRLGSVLTTPEGIDILVWGGQVEDTTSLVPASYIPTDSAAVTRAADNFAFEGTAFQKAFNPNSGALVFKVGEGSAESKATIGPLEFTDIQTGGAIALAWRGGDISVFKDGALDDTIYEDLSAAASLEFESIRLRSVSLYDHRPTDAQLEALTS